MAHLKNYFSFVPPDKVLTIDGVHVTLPHGWGIVRPSNTQPMLTARFEADTAAHLNEIKLLFIEALLPYYTYDYLQDIFTYLP